MGWSPPFPNPYGRTDPTHRDAWDEGHEAGEALVTERKGRFYHMGSASLVEHEFESPEFMLKGEPGASTARLVAAFLLGIVATLFVLWVMSSGFGTTKANATTLALGSPTQRPNSPGWWVPVYIRDLTVLEVQGVSLEVVRSGTLVVHHGEPGTFWTDSAVRSYLAAPDTFRVDMVKAFALGSCSPDKLEGVLAFVYLEGRGTVTLTPNTLARSCTNATLEALTLLERVLVPPERPIAVRRDSWSHVKGVYR